MADSFIQLSPDSTGKRVDTRTAPDGDHREVQVIGSPTTAEVAEADLANGLDVDVTRVQGSVAVTNAGLTALLGAIAGTEVQVDIVSGGSAGVQYTEDDAAPANPVGTALAMVRDDALSGLTTTDGDIVAARATDKGELYVKHVDAIPVTDNGGVLTVDGTVAVTNSDLTAIAASASVLDDWDESDRAKVNPIVGIAGVAAGAGAVSTSVQRVTLASDDPGVVSLQILDNAIAGSEMQVDVVAALPAGTNNIGDVDVLTLPALPAGTNNIGDVDVLSVIPGTGATNLGKAVDSVPGATDTGVVPLAVRDDALAALTPADGDYTQLRTDSTGALWVRDTVGGGTQYAEDTAHSSGDLVTMAGVVQIAADAALSSDGDRSALQVDGSGFLKVNIKAGAGSGGTAMADDAAFTPAVTNGTPAFGFADETAPDSVDEGDAGALRMTLDRKLLTRVVGATDANRLDIDGSGHAQVDIAAASVTVPVSAASLPLPTGASTLAEQQTQTTHLATIAGDTTDIEAAVELIDDTVKTLGTDTYTEATTKGLLIGAIRRDADTTLVDTTNEVSPLQVDANGRLKVEAFSGETLPVSGTVAVTGSVTANAGTNLNTSTLALEAGGNLATAVASLSVLDDWDETDRAKVNTIAGQVGVQGASGTVTALTQRVVLATDVGLPAGTANIGDVDVLTLPALVAGSANIGDVDVLTMPVTEVVGDVAADAAVPANPLSIGGRASTAVPTAVSADGDSVYNWLNRLGMQVVSAIPGLGLNADPHTLLSETAQYTTTQTSAVLVTGGASERIIVTSIQIQVGGTTAGTLQVYFGTGAYARGTDEAIFDGEFAPSATLKPGFVSSPPSGYRAGALGDDILVTTSAAINPLTITVWYYILGV